MAKNQAQLAKERKAKAAKELAARKKKIAQNKANANKPGYDKHGTKTMAQRKKEKAAGPKTYKSATAVPFTTQEAKDRAVSGKRPKVKSVASQGIKNRQRQVGPEENPLKGDNSGIKNLGVKKPKVKAVNAIKAKGGDKPKIQAKKLKVGEKASYSEQLAQRKRAKKVKKAGETMGKADKAAKSGKLKKAARLEKRSIRQAERAGGKRKTVAGTILKGAGLGLGRGLARLGGYGGKFKGKASDKKGGYVKPNPAALKPLGANIKLQNKAVDKAKDNNK